MSNMGGHWPQVARSWGLVGPPLRPIAADLMLFDQAVAGWHRLAARPADALILGVTRELYQDIGWPAGSRVAALDGSRDMIRAVWPGPPELACLGAWTAMPFAAASLDVILCDGGFGLLAPAAQRQVLREVARVLRPGGIFTVRLFAPMGRTGTLDEIAADLRGRRVASLDALKLRLWGALQHSVAEGVRPRDVVAWIHAASDNGRWLVEALGWNPEHVARLQVHVGSPSIYHLASKADLLDMVRELPDLRAGPVGQPAHDFGACCPVVTVRRT